MSLETLRSVRRQRLRPEGVFLVLRDCPRPWPWLLDDPAIVWLSPRQDVRAHDLRPLVGLPVTALVDSLTKRRAEVIEAVGQAGGHLVGIADNREGEFLHDHAWPDLAAQALVTDQRFFWNVEHGNPAG